MRSTMHFACSTWCRNQSCHLRALISFFSRRVLMSRSPNQHLILILSMMFLGASIRTSSNSMNSLEIAVRLRIVTYGKCQTSVSHYVSFQCVKSGVISEQVHYENGGLQYGWRCFASKCGLDVVGFSLLSPFMSTPVLHMFSYYRAFTKSITTHIYFFTSYKAKARACISDSQSSSQEIVPISSAPSPATSEPTSEKVPVLGATRFMSSFQVDIISCGIRRGP